jgi:2-hydroxy-3-keto-5-methylthiopentenyl-1-phosphate phosphatase
MIGERHKTPFSLRLGVSDLNAVSHFGHDKSIEIRKYSSLPDSERPTMFYAGDGVSDLSAAKETDLLFAKRGRGKLELSLQFIRSVR